MIIQDKIAIQLPNWQSRVNRLVNEFGDCKVCEVSVEQIYSGMRGVHVQVSDISYVDPNRGILFRGYTMQEVLTLLPRATGSEYPLAGGLYYLLMTNELPTRQNALEVEEEWKKRSEVPGYIFDLLDTLPVKTHPMTMFSHAILAMQNESVFTPAYADGLKKPDFWKATLEDSLNLTARLPAIAAYIYNRKYRDGQVIDPDPALDWSANFAHMIGKSGEREYQELTRLYFVLHSDHEGANVSAHISALVNSALSDIYYASSAAMNGLAGPLHGVANQECIRWLVEVTNYFGGLPTPEQLEAYCQETLEHGQLIPGYGHAVLRVTDPRFSAQLDFGKKYMPDDELLRLVMLVYDTLPGVLTRLGKVKNPWPNVDAISGTLQYHYGIKEFDFHTVMFGVSRILGLTSHAVWARALGKPIERPKSMTTRMLEELVSAV
ncbi:MAG: citrate (Si)-synthase [Anaerolineaceae bacterium]|nr:citrate (Si)-synthase [Anaerolineaceae bacterium]